MSGLLKSPFQEHPKHPESIESLAGSPLHRYLREALYKLSERSTDVGNGSQAVCGCRDIETSAGATSSTSHYLTVEDAASCGLQMRNEESSVCHLTTVTDLMVVSQIE